MKYIVFTFYGDGLIVAYRLAQEGHEVIVAEVQDKKNVLTESERKSANEDPVDKKRRLMLFNGMVRKMPANEVLDKMKTIKKKDDYFILFERNHLFRYAQAVAEMGFEGNFPTEIDYLFEQDRDASKNFVRRHYPLLNIASVKEFATISQAKDFLAKTEDVWVLKSKDSSGKTFVPDTDDVDLAKNQIIEMLETYKEAYEKAGFILELMIPWMIELTPSKMYYDGVPLAAHVDIENKTLGSGNLSIQTGYAADLIFPIHMEDRICEIAFPPIVDQLAKKHKGLFIWDSSLLISKKGGRIFFGEFCPNRPGYNEFFTQLAQLPTASHFFESVVNRQSPYTLGTVATSTTIFNLHRDPDDRQILAGSIVEYKPEIEKDIWFYDITKNKDRLEVAGYDTMLAAITGSGTSLNEAVDKMFKNINDFSFSGAYYRPRADYVSLDYTSSIFNRLNYGLDHKLFQAPFNIRVGDIK